MSKQLKVIIAIICIGLGLFWNQIPDLINRVDTPNTSVSIPFCFKISRTSLTDSGATASSNPPLVCGSHKIFFSCT